MTPRELVKQLGGSAKVAADLGLTQTVVANWYQRGIASEHYLPLWRLAAHAGVEWKPPGMDGLTLAAAEASAA